MRLRPCDALPLRTRIRIREQRCAFNVARCGIFLELSPLFTGEFRNPSAPRNVLRKAPSKTKAHSVIRAGSVRGGPAIEVAVNIHCPRDTVSEVDLSADITVYSD